MGVTSTEIAVISAAALIGYMLVVAALMVIMHCCCPDRCVRRRDQDSHRIDFDSHEIAMV